MAAHRRVRGGVGRRPGVRRRYRRADPRPGQRTSRRWSDVADRSPRMNRRVVVTGIGLITPLGTGIDESWETLRAGRSMIRGVDFLDPAEFKSRIAAMIPKFDPLDYMTPKRARRLDRFSQLSVASSRLALEHSCLTLDPSNGNTIGVNIGSALGGVAFGE